MTSTKFFNKTTGKENLHQKFDYIINHFQYDVMNYWNNWKAITNNVKIYKLGFSKEQEYKVFELMECNSFYDTINLMLEDFSNDEECNVYFNGRSCGYIVALNKNEEFKDLLFYDTYEDFVKSFQNCGYDYNNARIEAKRVIQYAFDFVVDFDNLCDDIRQEVLYMIENAEVEEYIYTTEHKAKRIAYNN